MIYCEAVPIQNANHPGVHRVFRGKQSVHLMADSEDELIEYALSIGMKREWLQKPGTWAAHFDVVGSRLERVLGDDRVKKVDRRWFASWWKARRERVEPLSRGYIIHAS